MANTYAPTSTYSEVKPIHASAPGENYAPLPEGETNGRVTAHAVQTILASPQALYQLWRDVESIPRWQEYVLSVTPTSANHSHWVLGDPQDEDSKHIEFDSEITQDIPGERLTWSSLGDDLKLEGTVTFVPASNGRGTIVTLIQTSKLPAFGGKIASLAKRSPKQIVIEDLRHFKQLAETGEIPSVVGQPHGPRGVSGGIKEWMYGENNPTPPGTSDQA